MKDYAVVKIDHRQYIVEPDKTYTVDKFEAEQGSKMDLQVLALSKAGKLEVGQPVLDKASVQIEIVDQGKGDKVSTFTYKAKARYRKRSGIRPRVTTFKVLSIK